jgi:hypothetical protein
MAAEDNGVNAELAFIILLTMFRLMRKSSPFRRNFRPRVVECV